jgi:hypothetical protein
MTTLKHCLYCLNIKRVISYKTAWKQSQIKIKLNKNCPISRLLRHARTWHWPYSLFIVPGNHTGNKIFYENVFRATTFTIGLTFREIEPFAGFLLPLQIKVGQK